MKLQLIVAAVLAVLVTWLAWHLFTVWSLPFSVSFVVMLGWSEYRAWRLLRAARRAETRAKIAALERELWPDRPQ